MLANQTFNNVRFVSIDKNPGPQNQQQAILQGAKQKAREARALNVQGYDTTTRNMQKTIYHSVEAAPRGAANQKSSNLPHV